MDKSLLTRRALLTAAGAFALILSFPVVYAQNKMPIGIIGAGKIGGTIGGLWVKAGHPVMFSSRNPDELSGLVAKLGPLAHAGTVAQAIDFGRALFIAVPYGALPQIGNDYKDQLKGKIMLDAGNSVPRRDGAAIAKETDDNGIGITSQKYLAGTRLVRAFNTLSPEQFETGSNRAGAKVGVPIAGDDPEAMRVAQQLVRDAGFEPVVAGGLESAKKFGPPAGPAYDFLGTAAEVRAKLGE